jgi:thymidylate synthase (methanogen type)
MEVHEQKTLAAWIAGLRLIKDHGTVFIDRERRECKEILNLVVTIDQPKADLLAPIDALTKKDLWVYPTLDELEDIILTRRKIPTIQYTYGSRIFAFQSRMNQVHDFIIPLLKKDPTTRRAIISLYDPITDSKINLKETPSLFMVFFKITGGKLHTTGMIRSNDFLIGWPTNLYQLFKLQEMVAQEVGCEQGSLTTISNSAHYFLEYQEILEDLLHGKP